MQKILNKVVYTSPPTKCDICQGNIADMFVDGATTAGPWANMCPKCYGFYGRGLGTGKGQKYEKQPNGTFLKTAG